jgi:hypothetical protein
MHGRDYACRFGPARDPRPDLSRATGRVGTFGSQRLTAGEPSRPEDRGTDTVIAVTIRLLSLDEQRESADDRRARMEVHLPVTVTDWYG